ncbi:MAG TPA: hypothetical protein PLC28_06075 [Spirochaetota bacterium]|nr:hypothetical protein [Spirochaetota bacterium]HPC41739.1 hypothetical protein [Spirochaetota bacterium]HPL18750.1 hypothetical protein [Spirochaetota bacterium]HRS78128.1 hypothetical protein [Spirochaetota bacterium]HRT74231.1 hypothetical protein [Spirochaetota bacterium]
MTHKNPALKSSLLMALAIIIGMIPACQSEPQVKAVNFPSSFIYYTDARGVFTLAPPPASTGYLLPLRGACSLPAMVIRVKKKEGNAPVRQITYLMKGSKNFSFSYVIKDGTGDYEVTVFGKKTLNAASMNGLCAFTVRSDAELPKNFGGLDISRSILAYVKRVTGKTVGSGECWDLAQEALDGAGADWNRPLQFGMLLHPDRDEIKAGDIIQFKSIKIERKLENGGRLFHTMGAPDHTAVIIGVEGKKKYRLAHQNSDGKRYVITSEVDLNYMTGGKFWIYRPEAGILE